MKIKVMTFNLRCRTPKDGINIFDNRQPRVLEVIKNENPDIIGFQEARNEMRDFLRKEFADEYYVIGCGRDAGYRGESTPIAYKRDRLELIGLDTFWLSDTPSVAGSKYENVDQCCSRLAVCAEFSPVGCENIMFVNTHLDVTSEKARIWGMEKICEYLSEYKGKYMLTGDMNDFPNSRCISIAKSMKNTEDATKNITHSYHEYGKIKENYKIDYIFTNAEVICSHAVEDIPQNGIYISDHYPICAEIEI